MSNMSDSFQFSYGESFGNLEAAGSVQERVIFDATFKTFRLYPGDSLYAFSISPELTLEHLYWGKKLPPGYDLRYLSQSSRMLHFNTAEQHASVVDDAVRDSLFKNLEWVSLETLQDTWRKNKNTNVEGGDTESLLQRRLENLSWRLMSKISSCPVRSPRPKVQYCEDVPVSPSDKLQVDVDNGFTNMNSSSDDIFNPLFMPLSVEKAASLFRSRSRSTSNPPLSADNRLPSQRNLHLLDSDNKDSPFTPRARTGDQSLSPRSRTRKTLPTGHRRAFERSGGQMGKGILNFEYSDYGTGDFRNPSFVVVDTFNGSSITPIRYRRHAIHKGKIPMPDCMPCIRFLDEKDATTLIVTMADTGSELEVDLIYVVIHNYDAITRRVVFRNVDTRGSFGSSFAQCKYNEATKVLQRASSFTLDFENTSTPFYLVQLSGSWGRERQVVETKLTHGTQTFGSTRGVSGHQHNPFAALTIGPPNENTGEVKGFSFIYSGNFQFEAELSEMGRLRINMGIHPLGFQWHLEQGETFNTPEAVLVRSGEGMSGMTRVFHRLFNDHLIAPLPNWARLSPPVLLNTWEAKYFDVDHTSVIEMAKAAVRMGIDLIVVDDGWFGDRNDDTTSMGDWIPNPVKFPNGLQPVSREINKMGCRFGLWFEPEMISEKSEAFVKHPNWYLNVPGRPRQVGRNQMVLDLTRPEVRDFLFDAMSAVLKEGEVDYIKWDMNRPLTEVFSMRESDVWQSETAHRYVLGLYELQARITKAFPDILLENCASGGGRFDPGMLFYSPQIWCSDNTDAIVRMKIQYGTSYVYPASCVGSHVSTVPNHITGNTTRARTRGFVAMCGTFGFELDLKELSQKDRCYFREQIAIYKILAPIIRTGDLYRLWDPFKISFAAWMFVSRDQENAVVFAFSLNSDHWSNLVPRLMLRGLNPDMEYEVTEPLPNNVVQNIGNLKIVESEVPVFQLGFQTVVLTGEILMSAGLPIKFYTLDDSVMFFINKATYQNNIQPSPSAYKLSWENSPKITPRGKTIN